MWGTPGVYDKMKDPNCMSAYEKLKNPKMTRCAPLCVLVFVCFACLGMEL